MLIQIVLYVLNAFKIYVLNFLFRYLSLVKESDGDEYAKTKFNDFRIQNFKLFLVTKDPFPKETLLEQTYPIRVHIPT